MIYPELIPCIEQVFANAAVGKKLKELDDLATPLILKMIELKLIPGPETFVEWEGFFEFDLIPVCHFANDTQVESWFNVHRNGLVEAF